MKNDPLHHLLVAAGMAALILAFASSVHAADTKGYIPTGTYPSSPQGTAKAEGITVARGATFTQTEPAPAGAGTSDRDEVTSRER